MCFPQKLGKYRKVFEFGFPNYRIEKLINLTCIQCFHIKSCFTDFRALFEVFECLDFNELTCFAICVDYGLLLSFLLSINGVKNITYVPLKNCIRTGSGNIVVIACFCKTRLRLVCVHDLLDRVFEVGVKSKIRNLFREELDIRCKEVRSCIHFSLIMHSSEFGGYNSEL